MFFRKRPLQAVDHETTRYLGAIAGKQTAFIYMPEIAEACPVSALFDWQSLPTAFHTCITIELRMFALATIFSNFRIELATKRLALCSQQNEMVEFLRGSYTQVLDEGMRQSLKELGQTSSHIALDDIDFYVSFAFLTLQNHVALISQYMKDRDGDKLFAESSRYMVSQLYSIKNASESDAAAAIATTSGKIFASAGEFAVEFVRKSLANKVTEEPVHADRKSSSRSTAEEIAFAASVHASEFATSSARRSPAINHAEDLLNKLSRSETICLDFEIRLFCITARLANSRQGDFILSRRSLLDAYVASACRILLNENEKLILETDPPICTSCPAVQLVSNTSSPIWAAVETVIDYSFLIRDETGEKLFDSLSGRIAYRLAGPQPERKRALLFFILSKWLSLDLGIRYLDIISSTSDLS